MNFSSQVLMNFFLAKVDKKMVIESEESMKVSKNEKSVKTLFCPEI